MGAFVKVFAEFGIELTIDEARGPMGLPKWDHINALLAHPDIAKHWTGGTGPRRDRRTSIASKTCSFR